MNNSVTNQKCKLLMVACRSNLIAAFCRLQTGGDFQVLEVEKINDATDLLFDFVPDLIILDSSGHELPALEFCSSVKSIGRLKNSLIIMLSDRKDERMEISAFHSGADDFIVHPVKIKALLERIKVRLKKPGNTITVVHDRENSSALRIDRESYSVSIGNQFVQLSRKEFELLYLMASSPDKLFRREEIFRLVWNKKSIGKNRTIDVHILRLRKKLGNKYISTQKGIGYRFVV